MIQNSDANWTYQRPPSPPMGDHGGGRFPPGRGNGGLGRFDGGRGNIWHRNDMPQASSSTGAGSGSHPTGSERWDTAAAAAADKKGHDYKAAGGAPPPPARDQVLCSN
jgi:hypothetical protein